MGLRWAKKQMKVFMILTTWISDFLLEKLISPKEKEKELKNRFLGMHEQIYTLIDQLRTRAMKFKTSTIQDLTAKAVQDFSDSIPFHKKYNCWFSKIIEQRKFKKYLKKDVWDSFDRKETLTLEDLQSNPGYLKFALKLEMRNLLHREFGILGSRGKDVQAYQGKLKETRHHHFRSKKVLNMNFQI